jgi:phosphotransferase system enzyme I (PtsI)
MSRRVLQGHGVSPGTVCAPVARLVPAGPPPAAADLGTGDPAARVREALSAVAADLAARARALSGPPADILRATAAMATDRTLLQTAGDSARAGTAPARAVGLAAEAVAATLEQLGGRTAERAADLRDVAARAAALLGGDLLPGLPPPGRPVVLAAHDLAPADTAALPGSGVVALLTEAGGPTSHTAIVARWLGVPAVVGCPGAGELPEGVPVLLDGDSGVVVVEPDAGERSGAGNPEDAAPGAGGPAPGAGGGPGRTRDGVAVPLLANIGRPEDAAAAAGSDGVGLFRTEFLFLDRRERPSRAEQAEAYRSVLAALGDRPVVVRTLDAGSDKPLPFLRGDDTPANPALGMRGLRTAAVHPDVLDDQLGALADAAAAAGRGVSVMAPMVATAREAAWFAAAARSHGLTSVGVMIEVPAAAVRAADLMAHVDFVSIGTNDLAQYAMAADRGSAGAGALLDPWQPALLELVALVGRAGRATGTPLGVCGEAAADPLLAVVLVGLGATSLSMAPAARAAVAEQLAVLGAADCAAVAEAARASSDPWAAREAARRVRDDRLP